MGISWRKAFFKISKFQKFLFNENFQKKFEVVRKKFFWTGNKMMGQDKSGKFSFNTCFCPTGREMTFENFFKSTFLKQPRVCQKQKKIRLDKYFGILSWKGAPVGKIKSFMVTSGLRFSKFRNFYLIQIPECVNVCRHCTKIFFPLLSKIRLYQAKFYFGYLEKSDFW